MLLKDISFAAPEENILYDDVLLELAEKGKQGEVLRFWESKTCFIVLGRVGKEVEDLKAEAIKKDGIAVLRRSSGGGTVVQGPGCLNYSLILSKAQKLPLSDIRKSYEFILNRITRALKTVDVKATFQPTSDIALVENQKKISGNAQKRGKKFILHHGTILYDFDLSQIEKYLKVPKDIPEYRQGRSHSEFVTNISVPLYNLKEALRQVFAVDQETSSLTHNEQDCLSRFLATKEILEKAK